MPEINNPWLPIEPEQVLDSSASRRGSCTHQPINPRPEEGDQRWIRPSSSERSLLWTGYATRSTIPPLAPSGGPANPTRPPPAASVAAGLGGSRSTARYKQRAQRNQPPSTARRPAERQRPAPQGTKSRPHATPHRRACPQRFLTNDRVRRRSRTGVFDRVACGATPHPQAWTPPSTPVRRPDGGEFRARRQERAPPPLKPSCDETGR